MDQKVHSIEKLLFVPLKRHTAFNGQISIGVGRRLCAREFAPSGDKPPPARAAYLLDFSMCISRERLIFVSRYKVSRFHLSSLNKESGGRHLQLFFSKKQIGR